ADGVRAPSTQAKIKRLLGGFGRGSLAGLFSLVPVVFLLELFHTAGGVDELHFAREEGMADGADLDGDVLLRAARLKLVPAAAGHGGVFVFGMDVGFHGYLRVLLEVKYCRRRRQESTRGGLCFTPSVTRSTPLLRGY